MDNHIAGLLLAALVAVLLVGTGAIIFWLRRGFEIGDSAAKSANLRVLNTHGVACWVELLAGASLAATTDGWSLTVWKQVAAHVAACKEPCPVALRARLEQVLDHATGTANNPMITAYIMQIRDALKR